MNLLQTIQSFCRRCGWDLVPYNAEQHTSLRRQKLLQHLGIDLVLDVGANVGQFAQELRQHGYDGRIVSFEPLADALASLREAARGDPAWQVVGHALGDVSGSFTMHRSANVESSSLLKMLPRHAEIAPRSRFAGDETVRVETLDAVFDQVAADAKRIFLKVDTQGFEAQVLNGASRSLERIDLLQLELSLVHLYEGQLLMDELRSRVESMGFRLIGLESSFADPVTGQVLQLDGTFLRARNA